MAMAADQELTTEEAFRTLAEIFADDPSAPRTCRKYVLEYQDDALYFDAPTAVQYAEWNSCHRAPCSFSRSSSTSSSRNGNQLSRRFADSKSPLIKRQVSEFSGRITE